MTKDGRGFFLVTGGSRGIGAACALRAARDWPVAIFYRERTEEAHQVVRTIERAGGTALAIQADVGDEDSLMRGFEALDKVGPLAVLVNNAGVTGGVSRVDTVTASALHEVYRVNVIGAFLASREAVRRMSTRHSGQGGAIVNISSGASVLGSPNNWVHYAASKGAIDTMTIGLSKEVAAEGIRVNAVRPGLIDTELQRGRSAEQLQKMISVVPLGRMGTVEEIAEAVVWLASPAAGYVTGCLLDARGGL
ncbi:NAD(P)-dependent oxidoreductase [Limnohabitans sp. Rim8]|uniref:SDR family oxidoreductase n=1 Tax=Limnohabitans sp. Rim8 TaxID=1100718 RepID=UPI000D37B66C|nr:SDR family oxidoreductase [Limnohabitans sp. Rim8]PUE62137.1 NAD(P)-dependent oxidoreductase [Limnohabitans sp. Rim8]